MANEWLVLVCVPIAVLAACGSDEDRGTSVNGAGGAGAAGAAGSTSGGTGSSAGGGSGGESAGGSAGQTTGGAGGNAGGGQAGESGAAGACPGCDEAIVNTNVGFEDGTFLDQWRLSTNNGEDCVMDIVSSPTRNGNHALHISHAVQGSGVQVW